MSQCPGSGYRPDVAATERKTPQRTIGVDDEAWFKARHIARKRRERVPDLLRRVLDEYVAEHDDLLSDFVMPERRGRDDADA